jgi:thiamine-monophosphate kinase
MRERELIDSIRRLTQKSHPYLIEGIGDDCGVFASTPGAEWLISTDMLVAGIHFDTRWHPPYQLGRKSLAVNLSDIAAMAGRPQFALLSLAVPTDCTDDWLSQYLSGFASMLSQYGCVLIGGDTVAGPSLTFSVTVLGTADPAQAVYRRGAAVGDGIYVSGYLGSAAAGLHLCQSEKYDITACQDSPWPELIRCHLDPVPQIELAERVRATSRLTAMQDISDGIATDLSHICTRSGVGALLIAEQLPCHLELSRYCATKQLDRLPFQLRGGEDYQLLCTIRADGPEEDSAPALAELGLSRIGTITAGRGVRIRDLDGHDKEITFQGYEHRAEAPTPAR